MIAFLKLLKIYADEGYGVRTGLNPYHFAGFRDVPFTALLKDGQILTTGGGIAPQEIAFFESLLAIHRPRRVFIVGNAFGWSTLAIALAAPDAQVVAIDSGADGGATETGTQLTNRLAAKHGLRAKVVQATSPGDVRRVVDAELGGAIDLAFVDGLHTNAQQELDFDAVSACAAPDCVFVFHDVVNWKLTASFEAIARRSGLRARILLRTPSGMGVLSPERLEAVLGECLDAFCEPHPPPVGTLPGRILASGLRTLRSWVAR